ncbi:leucine--tRNA ligase [Anaerofustis stercorihominis]|uniref:Leucine--tRNA ligase n=2 Tax=Anaerofustis stercorihominis TaxID=214853 RepID=A0A3E3DX57_9FIRM|nr:leucine--tRNA ligase [Anaerofustis stercorihominis]RGD73861.1 leucine--tRNA ligase [Anaerofustis stercorihominis]
MENYNFKDIEKKWQGIWDKEQCFHAVTGEDKPKYYALVEFPYPSGQGLHVGHPRPYTALDIVSRKKRMEGYNVLFPMGFDAFGLPTENYAIKTGVHPAIVTKNNIDNFKRQLKSLGYSFDWQREVDTTDPKYYKWTQWIFLQLFKKGLAYKKEFPINFCTSCKVGLANEEVVNGVCERCGGEVVRKVKNQWMLKITEYADRLIDDLEDVNFIDRVKTSQINWIGRSYGAEINFDIKDTSEKLTVYTTRPDTIYGATYMVISPEHPVIETLKDKISNLDKVLEYKEEAAKKSDFERTELNKEKTGVKLEGISAVNPITGKEISIFASDYVLMTYGTGAIMAVPAHDTRDYEFAKVFDLPIIEVVSGGDITKEAYTGDGKIVNSPLIDGLGIKEAKEKMTEIVEEKGIGKRKTNFKLRDWVFSRQRYWGEPIPIINCPHCGFVPLDESELPLTLPDVKDYKPTDDGESPLKNMPEWYNIKCPKCGADAQRETDTMPQWAGSSWYYLRYTDSDNDKELASKEAIDYWMNVDWYNGGMEHTTLHLLYSRFWHKFLYDIGVVNTKEPYQKRTSHGMILGENHEKMSKSKGNVVNPDEVIDEFGADTLRTYEMFIGDFEKVAPWSENGVKGCKRFLDRVSKMEDMVVDGEEYSKELTTLMHQTIKKVSEDFETLKFNTAIAQLMKLTNQVYDNGKINKAEFRTFLILLNPVAPHLTEELWQRAGFEGYLHDSEWPKYDEAKTVADEIEIPIQINGKFKGKVSVGKEASEEEVKDIVHKQNAVLNIPEDKKIVKEIYVKGRIYNIVVK